MNRKALLHKASLVGVSAVCCLALVGCSGTNYGYTGGVAATVNGSEIKEDTVTKYIQDYRTSAELTSNDAWANWMNENSLDPSTVREQVIDYYTQQELVKQACNEQGITVDEDTVNTQLQTMKANYDSDEAWKEALSTAGITEDQYREALEEGQREQSLQSAVAGETAVEDSAVLEMLNTYYTMFNGAKRSSHILFASGDTAKAEEVLAKINSGELDFATAATQYSTDTASASNGGDVGWDATSSFVTAYTDALTALEKDQVSGLVTSDYGIHIIKCTDVFTTDGTATSLDAFPTAFVDYVRNILKSQNQSTAYNDWFTNYKSQADIVINDMPSNVPYNLDMTQYQTSDSSSGTTTDTTTGTSSGDSSSTDSTNTTQQ